MPNELDQLADQGGPLTLPEPSEYDPFGWAAERTRKGVHSRARAEAAEGRNLLDPLFGTGGAERYQTWPERLVRSAATAPGDALAGRLTDEETVMEPNALARLFGADPNSRWSVPSSGSMIGRAQDVAGAAITGPLTMRPGAATLGSGATRPAIGDAVVTPLMKKYDDVVKAIRKYPDWHDTDPEHLVQSPKYMVDNVTEAKQLIQDMKTYDANLAQPITSTGPAPVFYSAVEQAVKSAKQNTASPDQWMGYIRNQPGVKAEELQWMGLEDWLKEQKGSVSRKQVDDYVASHKVELKEVNKRDTGGLSEDEFGQMATEQLQDYWEQSPHLQEQYKSIDEFVDSRAGQRFLEGAEHDIRSDYGEAGGLNAPKYSEYQLPGGENYREMLLTLPEKRAPTKEYKVTDSKGEDWGVYSDKADANRVVQQYGGRVEEVPGEARAEPNYVSSHWDEPNVLAHVRVNDREMGGNIAIEPGEVPVPSKKTLFLEEVQSDWHQAGRKQGYKKDTGAELQDKYNRATTDAERAGLVEQARSQTESVPDAPFKTTWPDLVLKRMIREAAEKGYDQIAWTPGEVQAARYDLSKQVKAIEYGSLGNDKYGITAQLPDGSMRDIGHYTSKNLADAVGKDLADKIIKGEGKVSGETGGVPIKRFEGLDLKVGGEGMKSFYDKMLVDKANALAKRHGGKVEKQTIGHNIEYTSAPDGTWYPQDAQGIRVGGPTYQIDKHPNRAEWIIDEEGGNVVHSAKSQAEAEQWIKNKSQPQHVWVLPITPKLRDAAIGKGFPLFSSGVPFVPVDHDPFAKRKPRLEPVDHDPFAVLPYAPNRA